MKNKTRTKTSKDREIPRIRVIKRCYQYRENTKRGMLDKGEPHSVREVKKDRL